MEPNIPIGHNVPFDHSVMYVGAVDVENLPPKEFECDLLHLEKWGRIDIWERYREAGGGYFLWAHTKEEWLSNEIITWTGTLGKFSGDDYGAYGSIFVYDLEKAIQYIVERHGHQYFDDHWYFMVDEDFATNEIRDSIENGLIGAGIAFAVSDGWAGFHHGTSGIGLLHWYPKGKPNEE